MKGVVFTEFLAFIEQEFDLAIVDHLITETNPQSGGAYTSVGTYDSGELLAMVVALSQKSGLLIPDLVRAFGGHLFQHFAENHADTMGDVAGTEELLSSVEDRIHVEVRKLFPDAELPTIGFEQLDDTKSELLYQSSRPFADLCEGLILAAVKHFGDAITVTREDLPPSNGTHAKFILVRS